MNTPTIDPDKLLAGAEAMRRKAHKHALRAYKMLRAAKPELPTQADRLKAEVTLRQNRLLVFMTSEQVRNFFTHYGTEVEGSTWSDWVKRDPRAALLWLAEKVGPVIIDGEDYNPADSLKL